MRCCFVFEHGFSRRRRPKTVCARIHTETMLQPCANERTTRKSVIPEKHRDKEILEQTEVGDYNIHDELWAEAQR